MQRASDRFSSPIISATLSVCLAIGAGLLLPGQVLAQFQQEQAEPHTYDMRFLDREGHKPSNPYTMSGNDYHQHSYHRMLLNSPYAGSSVGLGVNASKQVFNKDAYDYMNPNSKKINAPLLPPDLDPYVDNAYAPKLNKHYYAGYDMNKSFNQQSPFAGMESRFNATESPFDNKNSNNNSVAPTNAPLLNAAEQAGSNANQAAKSSEPNGQSGNQKYPSFLNPAQPAQS